MENKDSQPKREDEETKAASEAQEEQLMNENNEVSPTTIEAEVIDSSEIVVTETPEEESTPVAASKGGSKAWMVISAILAIVLVIVLIKPPFGGQASETIASVNGVKITKATVYDLLAPSGGAAAVDTLITQELINQAAEKAKVTVTEEDIQGELDDLIANFGSAEALDAALAQSNMKKEDLMDNITTNLQITKILEPKTDVTDEKVQAYYDENKAGLATPHQVRISHILVGTKQEAEDIVKQLNEGADFAKLAAEKSIDTTTKDNGGDLNFMPENATGEAAFDTAAFSLETNEISGVIETSSGFHVLKKTEDKAANTPTFEEKKEDIRKQLLNEQIGQLSTAWMEGLRSEAKITNSFDVAPTTEETTPKE